MQHPSGPSVDRSVRLPADLATMLAEEARLSDSTEATVIRQALRAYLTARQTARAAEEAAARERAQALEEGPHAGDGGK